MCIKIEHYLKTTDPTIIPFVRSIRKQSIETKQEEEEEEKEKRKGIISRCILSFAKWLTSKRNREQPFLGRERAGEANDRRNKIFASKSCAAISATGWPILSIRTCRHR